MREVNKELWALMDEFRGERFDLPKIIRVAKQRGINVDYSTLRSLSNSLQDADEYFLPESIPSFVLSILKDFLPKTILDPWANTGSLLSPIAEFFKSEKILGITSNQSSLEIAQLLAKNENITWKHEDPFYAIDNIKGNLDLIVSAPPFGLNRKISFSDEVGLKDNFGNLLILKACQRLNDNGVGIFVVSPSFFFDKRPNTVKSVLSEYGLYLDAAFLLLHGTFEPITSINTYLEPISKLRICASR